MNGVTIRTWSVLESLTAHTGAVTFATFSKVTEVDGQLKETGEHWSLAADTVLKAIGQTLVLADAGLAAVKLRAGRIDVNEEGRTSLRKVWAGGDCTFGGRDLTVEAVDHGQVAANSIHNALLPAAARALARVRGLAV